MPKIKRKIEMTLPKLIEWVWENEVSDKAFYSNIDGGSVYLDKIQNLSIEHEIAINETFTVEVEEEITEDTLLEEVLLIVNDGLGVECFSNQSINDVLGNNEGYYKESVMLILKPIPTIIWTSEKGLVE
ncbi:hypothetical protein [Staphylococcus haemolyticus]|uniref:hypothetical protein n=1 Tax=Staphylococcus haemolyticus TaxID=1283 RepID=UPI001F0A863C|nr:hypothetical protein [Staphylococcus haemolyticus]MCH4435699.1 hypothetical protein [Staphylococcus haemolyticus]